MVEGWPFTVAYRHAANLQNVSFQSNERLNLVVTPAAFRSLGDLRSFLQLLNTVPDPHGVLGNKTVARCLTHNWLAPSRAKMSTLYRCQILRCYDLWVVPKFSVAGHCFLKCS